MKKTQLVLILFILLYSSCEKEDVSKVFAGKYDSTFIYNEFSPSLKMDIVWDDQKLYGFGQDSIDIDFDLACDVFITLAILNYDSAHLLNELPNPWPCCKLQLKNGFEVATYGERVGLGHGYGYTEYFVDVLNFGERVDQVSIWNEEVNTLNIMWRVNPGGLGAPPYGDWYYVNNIKYIGIRMNMKKYGWIEVDSRDHYNPKIIRHAIQK